MAVGLRVDAITETEGLDQHEHGLVSAYGDYITNESDQMLVDTEENELEVTLDEAIPIHLSEDVVKIMICTQNPGHML